MIQFELPSLGSDMDQGKLLVWHVKPGDQVKRGQVVAVVDTSKAAVDVEIWQDGVVAELLVQPGETVPVGTVLATLLEPGEIQTPVETPIIKPTVTKRHAVSPSARKRAHELGINPDVLNGTGAQGSVTLADVESAAHIAVSLVAPADTAQARQSDMRKAIAAAMSRSKREIPHYYLSETISMAAARAWLQQHNENLPITARILPIVLQIKAVAIALQKLPQFNGYYREGEFHPVSVVNAGVAISLRSGGLVAPALMDVSAKSLEQLMVELTDLVKRARAGSLRSSEMSEPGITITNLGEMGVESVFGVIYPPQVALVGFGRITERPWIVNKELHSVPLMTATLAADHRVSDGHQGALFLAELRDLLQIPERLSDTQVKGESA